MSSSGDNLASLLTMDQADLTHETGNQLYLFDCTIVPRTEFRPPGFRDPYPPGDTPLTQTIYLYISVHHGNCLLASPRRWHNRDPLTQLTDRGDGPCLELNAKLISFRTNNHKRGNVDGKVHQAIYCRARTRCRCLMLGRNLIEEVRMKSKRERNERKPKKDRKVHQKN